MAVKQGYGSTISFATGYFGKIKSINTTGPTREALDVTHMASADNRKEYIPGTLVDAGEVSVEMYDVGGAPPIENAAETVTIVWSTGRTMACSGFLTEAPTSADVEGVVMTTCKVKFTGKETIS